MTEPNILFVCLGNICRSPVAEGLFRNRAAPAGLSATCDSAGTGDWHIGDPPQPGSIEVARANGFDISGLSARQVRPDDFQNFTHLVALDRANLSDLKRLASPGATASMSTLLSHADSLDEDVLDPWGMDTDAFETMFAQIDAGITGLIRNLRQAM
ncbi:MAG: low molecular weight protein-tyrosine-phosphatase [Pseudomonadota bacterium]